MVSISDLASSMQNDLSGYTQDYLNLSKQALEPEVNTSQNVIAQAVASAIPVIAGLISGRPEGMYGGFQGGLASYKGITDLQKENAEREAKSKLLEAQTAGDRMKELRKSFNDLQMLQATEPYKQGLIMERQMEVNAANPNQGTKIINMQPLRPEDVDKITNLQVTSDTLKDFRSFLEQNFSEQLKNGEGLLEVFKRLGTSKFSPGSKEQELQSRVAEIQSRLIKDLNTGTPSDYDAQRILDAITGGSLSDIKLLDKRIESFINRTDSYVNKFQENMGRYAGRAPFEEIGAAKAPAQFSKEDTSGTIKTDSPEEAANMLRGMKVGQTIKLEYPDGRIKEVTRIDQDNWE